jgi:hypothetical protein
LITFFASFSAFNFSFSSFFLLLISFFLLSLEDAELVGFKLLDDFDIDVEEETVYGLNPNDDADGLTLAGCEFVLLISVAFDMIGATLELFILNFFDDNETEGDGDVAFMVGSSNKGTISDAFIAFDDDDDDV